MVGGTAGSILSPSKYAEACMVFLRKHCVIFNLVFGALVRYCLVLKASLNILVMF